MVKQYSIPEPDYDDPKELYAIFGFTFFRACILEQGVINYAVALQVKGTATVTAGEVTSLFDKFEENTFGRLVKSIERATQLSSTNVRGLRSAVKKRNYLAHDFWRSHDLDLTKEEGRRTMIDELLDICRFLVDVDREMDEVWLKAWESLGVSQEWIENEVDRLMREER